MTKNDQNDQNDQKMYISEDDIQERNQSVLKPRKMDQKHIFWWRQRATI